MKMAIDAAWPRVDTPRAEPHLPSEEDVRAALMRIAAHPLFARSIKLQRFLNFVVEETLAGRADRLKAYNIATVALGRPDSFDPAQDPIVRVEASRLRRALTAYYASEGMHDPLRIVLHAGSYQPLFETGGTLPGRAETVDLIPPTVPSFSLTKGMTRRERFLFGLIVLLFLFAFCNTAMLTLTVLKLDEMERALGMQPNATSHFEAP